MQSFPTANYRPSTTYRVDTLDELKLLRGNAGESVVCYDPAFGGVGRVYDWDGEAFIDRNFWRNLLTMQAVWGGGAPAVGSAVTTSFTSTGGAATQITNGILIDKADANISYSADMKQSGTGFPDNTSIRGQHVGNGTGRIATSVIASFCIDCTEFEIRFKYTGTHRFRLFYRDEDGPWINGGDAVLSSGTGGSSYRLKYTFGSAKQREIRLEMGDPYIYEWVISQNGTLYKSDSIEFRSMIVGDSFSEGGSGIAGVFGSQDTWGVRLAGAMGWKDHWTSAVGGTGYLENAGTKINAVDRINTDIIPYAPDLLITALGVNDPSYRLEDQILTYIDRIKAALPQTVLGFVSAWNPRSTGDGTRHSILQSALAKRNHGSAFLIDGRIFTGTGRVSAPANNGNSDVYVGADGTHPTSEGHRYLAHRVRAELLRIARQRALS